MTATLNDIKHKLFGSRQSLKEVQDWIQLHPREDRLALYTAMHMALNTLIDLIQAGKIAEVTCTTTKT